MIKQIPPRAGAESGNRAEHTPLGRTAGSIPATGATDRPLWPFYFGCLILIGGVWALIIAIIASAPTELTDFLCVLAAGGAVLFAVESLGLILDS